MDVTPHWTSTVVKEACQSSSWEKLVDAVELRMKKSNNLTKRFAEYTEYEQAIIVEQEIKNVSTKMIFIRRTEIMQRFFCAAGS